MTTVSTTIRYNLESASGVVGENLAKERARFNTISNWKLVDKLNKLTEYEVTLPNDDYGKANVFLEKEIFVPFLNPFRGFIVGKMVNDSSIIVKSKEFATHFERRIFKRDSQKRVTYTDVDWYNKLWKYRQKYTVKKQCVVDEIKKYPININMGEHEGFRRHALPNGDDFVITAKDGVTKIPHEIESYDNVTGELVVWARLPKVSDSGNTIFYVYFGNDVATNQEDITNVWKGLYEKEESDNIITYAYSAVWHLHADSVDSTENNNDGTDTAIVYTGGKVGNSANFDALTSYIDVGSGTSIDDIYSGTNGGWISVWINPNSDGESSLAVIFGKSGTNNIIQTREEVNGFMKLRFYKQFASTSGDWKTTNAVIPINKWTKIDVIYDQSDFNNLPRIFINGTEETAITTTTQPVANDPVSDAANTAYIGNNDNTATRTFDGEIDELRLMKGIPLDFVDIIKTEYDIQNTPTECIVVGFPEEYKKPCDEIAENIVNSANLDMPILDSLNISNLVCMYKFDNNAQDSKGTNHGTWTGTEKYSSEAVYYGEKCAVFNTSAYITTATKSLTDFDFNSPMAVSFWYKGSSGSAMSICGKTNTQQAGQGWGITQRSADRMPRFTMENATNNGIDCYPTSTGLPQMNDGNWHHIVFTKGSVGTVADCDWYIDNVKVAVTTANDDASGSASNSLEFVIGAESDGGNPLQTGSFLDDFRVYNKKISVAEVSALYNATQSDVDTITRRVKWKVGTGNVTKIPNLISLWKFDENVIDSKSENHGEVIGNEAYKTGQYAKGIYFDGSTYVSVDHDTALDFERTDPLSISFWMKTPNDGVSTYYITKNGFATASWAVYSESTSQKLRFSMRGTAQALVAESSDIIEDDKLHHIVITKSTASTVSGVNMYIDGVKQSVGNISDTLSTTTLNNAVVTMGGNKTTQPMVGILDDVRIYDRELTEQEALALYNATDSGIDRVRTDNFPTKTTSVGFQFKNHYEALNELALVNGKDVFFDNQNHYVFIETKGKLITDKLDLVITSNPEANVADFANDINILGKKDEYGTQLENNTTEETNLRYDYEKVITDGQLSTSEYIDDIANNLLKEFKKLHPQIKGTIPIHQFHRFSIQSGDRIIVNQPKKGVVGTYRVMDVKATSTKVDISLENVETGIIRVRSNSFTDTIDGILMRIRDSDLAS